MVYTHAGFAVDGHMITVDYSKTCAEIYVDFACSILNSEGLRALFHLFGGGTSPKQPERLPSWVPDWTEPEAQSKLLKLDRWHL